MVEKQVKRDTVACPQCKGGVLFDVTPRIGVAMNVKHVQCDKCKAKYAFNIGWGVNK